MREPSGKMDVALSIEPGFRIIPAKLMDRLLSGKPISLLQDADGPFLARRNRGKLLFGVLFLPVDNSFAELEPL